METFNMRMDRGAFLIATACAAFASACSGANEISKPLLPVDPKEPVFAAAQNKELFYDGFEGFTSSAQLATYQSVYPDRYATAGTGINLTSSGAVAGQKAVRFTYPASSNQGNELLEVLSTADNDPAAVVVTFWLRSQPNYTWWSGSGVGGQAHKIFIANISGAPDGNRILLEFDRSGIEPTELNACFPGLEFLPTPTWSIGPALYKQNLALGSWSVLTNANDGQWHRYTTRFQKATVRPSTAQGNGRIEMWVDGLKIMEYIGDDPSRCEYGLVSVPTVRLVPNLHFPSVNGAVNATQWLEFDDMRIWSP
jgi:hypothetical protein